MTVEFESEVQGVGNTSGMHEAYMRLTGEKRLGPKMLTARYLNSYLKPGNKGCAGYVSLVTVNVKVNG